MSRLEVDYFDFRYLVNLIPAGNWNRRGRDRERARERVRGAVAMGAQEKSQANANSMQRVKVYRLNDDGKWDDQGTGHVTVDYLERSEELGLFVIDEDDNETILLHRISPDDIYRKQEDTIISWRDPEYSTELTLSFQETTGCSYIWDNICNVQRNLNFNSLNKKHTATAKERMAEKGKAAMDRREGRKKRRIIPNGPSLVSDDDVAEVLPLLRKTRATAPLVTVAVAEAVPEVPQAIPLRVSTGVSSGDIPDVEIMESDKGIPEESPRNTNSWDPAISPNYFRPPPALGSSSGVKPINPETDVDFLCAHGNDLLRSGEMSGYGKMSNVDRIRHGQANMLQAIGNLLHMEKRYGDTKRKFDRLRKEKDKVDEALRRSLDSQEEQKKIMRDASVSYRRAKSSCRKKHDKICDYRGRIARANETIRGMKADLGDNAVDMFVASEEFQEIQEGTFDRALKDIRKLLGRSYPDFDFSSFYAEVQKAIESRVRKQSAPVADKSGDFCEEPLSDGEPERVSSDDERFAGDLASEEVDRTNRD